MDKKTKEFVNQEQKWYLIDATNKPLGRLASRIAYILIGKHKVTYSPSYAGGDHIVVINCSKIKLTGKKMLQSKYYRHSGHLGNLREYTAEYMLKNKPEQLLRLAVSKMLPKNKQRKIMLKRLKIYRYESHKHAAQNPQKLEV
ncbi:MAG: 50S ribosomal protein L13 [bacterium]